MCCPLYLSLSRIPHDHWKEHKSQVTQESRRLCVRAFERFILTHAAPIERNEVSFRRDVPDFRCGSVSFEEQQPVAELSFDCRAGSRRAFAQTHCACHGTHSLRARSKYARIANGPSVHARICASYEKKWSPECKNKRISELPFQPSYCWTMPLRTHRIRFRHGLLATRRRSQDCAQNIPDITPIINEFTINLQRN